MAVQFPLSMLPNTRAREPGWRAWDRDKDCKIQKMHFRTKHLTEYVERELPAHGFLLERRIQKGSRRQRLFEATYRNKPFSFLIVPAANQWVHVSPLLQGTVDHAIVVTFDRQLDDLAGIHDHPSEVQVFSIRGDRMVKLAESIRATSDHRRSEHVAIPLFDSVLNTQPGNHQCSQGSLERWAQPLWTAPVSWVRTSAEMTSVEDDNAVAELVEGLLQSGRKLKIETDGSSFVVDPSHARFSFA